MKAASLIRDVVDFPKPGIIFKDITPLLGDGAAFREVIDRLAEAFKGEKLDKVLAAEARGFIFGSALAYRLGLGFVPVRKPGKLPYKTTTVTYDLEYGTDSLCMHEDAIRAGERVLIVDDVLATGGTAVGMKKLVEGAGGRVAGFGLVIELDFLHGREKLPGEKIVSLIHVGGD